MSFQPPPLRRPLLLSAAVLVLFGLMFVWSITGTIALRNVLLALLLAMLPLAGIDWPALKRCMTRPTVLLLLALTVWIAFQSQFLAWDPSRAWSESTQWFKAMLCLGLGIAIGCTPRRSPAILRWRLWATAVAAAWALHLILNILLKDWASPSLAVALQAGTPVGTRDMVSYLGTGLLALLLADIVARAAGREKLFPLSSKWLWASILATVVLTTATVTRNAILVMAFEVVVAMVALIGTAASKAQRSRRTLLAVAVLALVALTIMANVVLDGRWKNFADSARIGWDIEHSTWWIDQVKNPQPTNAQGVPVDHSAYNRVAWVRGASHLIAEYPLGTGYDRNAFRRALMKHYGAAATASGHAHAGLLDFTLATGVPGGIMLIAALLMAIGYGWRHWQTTRDAAGLALVLFVVGYLLRASVDGIVRDHMLEQAMFVTGWLLAACAAARSPKDGKA